MKLREGSLENEFKFMLRRRIEVGCQREISQTPLIADRSNFIVKPKLWIDLPLLEKDPIVKLELVMKGI